MKSATLASAPRAPDSPAFHFVPLRYAPVGTTLRRTPTAPPSKERHCPQAPSAMPLCDSAAFHFVKTGETGGSPGHRITGPSSGNARKLAGLRCGPVMRWPPMFVWPLAGQANSSLLPTLLSQPVQKPEQRDPAPLDRMPLPRRRESGQLLLRLRCSFLRVWAYAELPALTPPPMSASPLAVRVPRWALRLTLPPLSHGPALHTPGQK